MARKVKESVVREGRRKGTRLAPGIKVVTRPEEESQQSQQDGKKGESWEVMKDKKVVFKKAQEEQGCVFKKVVMVDRQLSRAHRGPRITILSRGPWIGNADLPCPQVLLGGPGHGASVHLLSGEQGP